MQELERTKDRVMHLFWFSLVMFLAMWTELSAQSIQLRERNTGSRDISVRVGDVVTVDIYADLSSYKASGVSVFITIPDSVFQVIDQRPTVGVNEGQPGVQPFIPGPLFAGAGEQINDLIPETETMASTFVGQQMNYAVVVGGAGDRARNGTGLIGSFQLACVLPVDYGQLNINDNALLETRLVLFDGISEQRFLTVQGMTISVSGLELFDVPDVILLPGRSDSTQIGRLSRYVKSARPSVDVDSIKWSVMPESLDSLQIRIDSLTSRVTVIPHPEWSGRQRVYWTATEPEGSVSSGQPLLVVQDPSEIVVNYPPEFSFERDVQGVRRDTIRIEEDLYSYVGDSDPKPSQAFIAYDLDTLATDRDEDQLRMVALGFSVGLSNPNVIGSVSSGTNELLIWSLKDFEGTDSLKVLANDGFRGGVDTLVVVVEVGNLNDAPSFLLDGDERTSRMRKNGSIDYFFDEIVEDIDSPFENLSFSWIDDANTNFGVDTTRTDGRLEINVSAAADYIGEGRVTFIAQDDEGAQGTTVLFLSASDVLPPTVLVEDLRIELTPGGPIYTENLDDFVEDPDDEKSELVWTVPEGSLFEISIDENRILSASAAGGVEGFEEVLLSVEDESGEGDQLKLVIYASLGGPKVAGIPDFIMDRGDVLQVDLDEYVFDPNDSNDDLFWEIENRASLSYVEVEIDGPTHIATINIPDTAEYESDPVVFKVTDPVGNFDVDSLTVLIRPGGGQVAESFTVGPLPTGFQVYVNQRPELFDLDDYVNAPSGFDVSLLDWTVAVLGGDSSVPRIIDGNIVSVFGFDSGVDTLLFTAQDTLGRVQTATATISVIGESEILELRDIPDIQFIAGQVYKSQELSDYVVDRETHLDSMIQWSVTALSNSDLIVRVTSDQEIQAIADDTLEVQVLVKARNSVTGVEGQDTIRVVALDQSFAYRELGTIPPVVVGAGRIDSSTVLNDYIPAEFVGVGGLLPSIYWTVSGQNVTQPVINPDAPHRLAIQSIGGRIGVDTLRVTANINGGFRATGILAATIVEPIDDSTLELEVVPNPIAPSFLDVFVVARRPLAGTPNVIRTFGTIDSTVAIKQLEADEDGKGVLIWSGGAQLPTDVTGTVSFEAQAFTEAGTNVGATASIEMGTVAAGKRLTLVHGYAEVQLPVGAVKPGVVVAMQGRSVPKSERAKMTSNDGLELKYHVDLYPLGLGLSRPGVFKWNGSSGNGEAIYRRSGSEWEFLGAIDEPLEFSRIGRFSILLDRIPPTIQGDEKPNFVEGTWPIEISDSGSGIDDISWFVNGKLYPAEWNNGYLTWRPILYDQFEADSITLRVRDRVGNVLNWPIAKAAMLPTKSRLGMNYPNPFNPETVIPFILSDNAGFVNLVIYNSTGQLVRELLSEDRINAGLYQQIWDGLDQSGRRVASGIYIAELRTFEGILVRRMALLK
ncbi:MAG: FlgD immunoglobulin-like domain containing protein [Candidatus Latescibacterota bacterium]|nr:FlgD immunoglobulin-like domain containing protein [Candidatus Latescibacterota bacterium]